MSESTLTLSYSDIQKTVGRLLGYGTTVANWTTDQVNEVDEMIQSGLRKFYFPQASQYGGHPYRWSFLYFKTSLTSVTDYTTGTVSSSGTTVTLSGGIFPTWAYTNGTLIVGNEEYIIASRTDNTHIELTSTPSVAFSSDTFTLKHNGNYVLPDDFGNIEGTLTYSPDSAYSQITKTSENSIRMLRSLNDSSDHPYLYAIRTKTSPTTSASTRKEMMLYPRPSEVLVFEYSYSVLMNKLTSSTNPYPYGGSAHSETILEAILSVMEQRGDNQTGLHSIEFEKRLIASIAYDQENAPDYIGYNKDCSDVRSEDNKRHNYFVDRNIKISYN